MGSPGIVAVLDTDRLYQPLTRDILIGMSLQGMYRAVWSRDILAETERNIARHVGAQKATAIVSTMRLTLPAAEVTGYAKHIARMKNNPKDRHVVAAAVEAGVSLIVTQNLKDFAPLPMGITAIGLDDFLCLFLSQPDECWRCLEQIAEKWPDPPEVSDLLSKLQIRAGNFASRLIHLRSAH